MRSIGASSVAGPEYQRAAVQSCLPKYSISFKNRVDDDREGDHIQSEQHADWRLLYRRRAEFPFARNWLAGYYSGFNTMHTHPRAVDFAFVLKVINANRCTKRAGVDRFVEGFFAEESQLRSFIYWAQYRCDFAI